MSAWLPITINILGLLVVVFFSTLVYYFSQSRKNSKRIFERDIPAYSKMKRSVEVAVETGNRMHLSLGYGGLIGPQAAISFSSLKILEKTSPHALLSENPAIISCGDPSLNISAHDVLETTARNIELDAKLEINQNQLTGLSPFSFAVGALQLTSDRKTSVNILSGSFDSESALMLDSAERSEHSTIAGSANLIALAVFFSGTIDPIIGEELFAAGGYFDPDSKQVSGMAAEDIFRWVIIGIILMGTLLNIIGGL